MQRACLLLSFLVIVLLGSCGKRNRNSTTCRALPPNGTLRTNINGEAYQMPYWETIMGTDSSIRYLTTDGGGTTSQLAGLIHWLGLPEAKMPKCLVIYSDTAYRQGEDLTLPHVLGCQYYYVDAGSLMHSFYRMQEGSLAEVPTLRGKAHGISFNDRQDLYELYFMKHHKTVVAWDVTDNDINFQSGGRDEISESIQQLKEREKKNY